MKTNHWYGNQLRILQTVLREPDIVGYDARSVVKYMEEIRANCLVINAGGVVDFFRNNLETANPNPFMTNEEILKDLVENCHRKGIKVIARVDFRGVDKRIYDLYPDWFAVDENGQPLYWGNSSASPNPLYTACYLSYYRNGHAFRFADILFQTYDVDGIWENAPFQIGACYCKTCREQYRKDTGKDIPRGGDFNGPQYDEYRQWKAGNLNRHLRNFREKVKSYGEDKIFCAEIFGLFYNQYAQTSSDLYQVKSDFDILVTPLFTANYQPLSAPSTLIKFLKGLEPEKVPVMLFGHLGTDNELRYVSSPDAETRIWMWQAVSSGGSLWNCLFNGHHPGVTFDRRNAYLCKDVYEYMEKHAELLNSQTPEADVAIYYSRNTNNLFGSGNRDKDAYITHIIGLEQALISSRLQYRFLPDLHLSEDSLRGVRCLLIPNGACLSDREIETIRKYVENGGNLLATYETSLYREDGTPRDDFGLNHVFGCSFTGIRKDASHYGYQYIRDRHPLTRGFEDTKLIANWGTNLLVRPLAGANTETPITYVPQIYPQPPERAWPRNFETGYPTCIVNGYGKGRSVYFPYGADKYVWSHGHRDFTTVLRNALDYLLEGRQHVRSNAPSSVHWTLNRAGNGFVLHAVNTTSGPKRPVLELVPVHDIQVELELEGNAVTEFQVLKSDAAVTLERTEPLHGGLIRLRIRIERLDEYSGIYMETSR